MNKAVVDSRPEPSDVKPGMTQSKPDPDQARQTMPTQAEDARLIVEGLNIYYGATKVVHNVSLSIRTRKVTAIIGPSGCGKSTFIRCLNRMHEVTPGGRAEGKDLLDGEAPSGSNVARVQVRRRPVLSR